MKIKAKTKKQRQVYFEALENIPGYVCRTCWGVTAWEPKSKEPKCQCKEPNCGPVNIVVPLPLDWWQAGIQ